MNKKQMIRGAVFGMASLFIIACDDNTSKLGIFSDTDGISNSYGVFDVYTNSLQMDSVLSNSVTSYLGSINDPETETTINANFAAQFHIFENYELPKKELMFPHAERNDVETKKVKCDAAEIRLYFENYYGDKNNPMKMQVFPLSSENIMEETMNFYTSTDLEQFVAPGTEPVATKTFTPADYTLTDAELNSSSYSQNVKIELDAELGTKIMNMYYEHPEYFRDSYTFIRKVFPGLYFKIQHGTGTMLYVDVATINLNFTYYDEEKEDTTYSGLCRIAATQEVIQSTQFSNNNLKELVEDSTCTYLKTPAGICTEVRLPVSEIYKEHPGDSISKAKLTLTKYNSKEETDYTLGTPSNLLLVRKKDMLSFFKNNEVADSKTAYTTSYDATYNTYTFPNLSRLISYCQHEKMQGMRDYNMTEEEWEAANPDWNRVVLIPVKISTSSDSYGNSYLASVTHDMDMSSIRLVGGSQSPIKMQVIYSKFE